MSEVRSQALGYQAPRPRAEPWQGQPGKGKRQEDESGGAACSVRQGAGRHEHHGSCQHPLPGLQAHSPTGAWNVPKFMTPGARLSWNKQSPKQLDAAHLLLNCSNSFEGQGVRPPASISFRFYAPLNDTFICCNGYQQYQRTRNSAQLTEHVGYNVPVDPEKEQWP